MREIKFRAWDKEENAMVSWEDMITKYEKTFLKTFFKSKHLIPMQFTGLKDAKGKEIYEGDKVQYNECVHHICGEEEWEVTKKRKKNGIVNYNQENASFWLNGLISNHRDLKIVGNIYEEEK